MPFHLIEEVFRKFVPLAVKVNPAAPAVIPVGEIEVSVGTGLFPVEVIVKVSAFEVPPPGAGLTTVTDAVPAVATRAALTIAANCNPLTKVVVRDAPFHLTDEAAIKFVPLTVRVNCAAPAVILAGESEVAVGAGLLGTGLMVNAKAFDVPPPGVPLKTVTLAVPAVAISAAVTEAVNWVALV